MGLAAATMFFLRHRKHRDNSNNIGSSSSSGDKGELVSHDLARVHDSVIVTKQKKRVSTGQQQPVLIAASTGGLLWSRCWVASQQLLGRHNAQHPD